MLFILKTKVGEIIKTMISVRLSPELEERLNYISKKTGYNKSALIRQALLKYLDENEDRLLALSPVKEKN